jgi:hypothetical protein
MRDRFRALIEEYLPWYDREVERARDQRSAHVVDTSIAARLRSEQVLAEYAKASKRIRTK